MSEMEITTEFGTAVPPAPRHAITTHMPTWQAILDFLTKPDFMQRLKNMYPRMVVHRDIVALTEEIKKFAGIPEGTACLFYTSLEGAEAQIAYVTDPRRGDQVLQKEELALRVFRIDFIYYGVLYPAEKKRQMMKFWMDAGLGVSSRMAEESMKNLEKLEEVKEDPPAINNWDTEAALTLKRRIADLLERAPVGGERATKVQPRDVYLYQNGMAAIWWVHDYLNKTRAGASVLYGFPFHCTMEVLKDFGNGFKHLGLGAAEELDELDAFCRSEKEAGRSVQAVWAEFPSNPMLTTPDLSRLRQLADEHNFILCIDDTIGSFCNVDVMGSDGADVVLSSLTKSFNGYADAMGGSAVLNPLSPRYPELCKLFEKRYHNDTHPLDLEQLEKNSRDYMERSKALNENAQAVVQFLHAKAEEPGSAVKEVMYPSVHRDAANYRARMRPATDDFQPGYGCLFSVEFETVPATVAFYDELGKHVHAGPHLGAHRTLVLCYVKVLYANSMDAVERWGLREASLRVSVGFQDDAAELVGMFRRAVEVADGARVEMERAQQEVAALT